MKLYRTYAAALADVASHASGAFVDALSDETMDGAHTRYEVVDGALVFALNMDLWRTTLAARDGAKKVGFAQDLTTPVARTAADKMEDVKSILDGVTSGTADATADIEAMVADAIDKGFSIDLLDRGTYNVSQIRLNDPRLSAPAEGDYEREHVRAFRGRGGRYRGPLFKAIAGSTGPVIDGHNAAGISVGGFRVNGSGVARGVDLSWIGAGQAGGTAPSNGCDISNIWVEEFKDVGINLDKCHDSDISRIFTRSGSGDDPIACSLKGSGGFIGLRDSVLYGGRTVMSCQNGQIERTVLSGLELVNASWNHLGLDACHFIALTETWGAITSSATGNATRAVSIANSAFISILEGGYFRGRWWLGAKVTNSLFRGGVLTSGIVAAAGSGHPPVFVFEHCSFERPIVTDPNALHIFIHCRDSTGARFTRSTGPVSWYNLTRLLVNTDTANASEAATIAGGWLRVGYNAQGILPSDNQGIGLGWNYSNGRGEGVIAINGNTGSAPGLDIITHKAGVSTRIARMTSGAHAPGANNVTNLGQPEFLYAQVFAAIGAINQSDGTLKQDVQAIPDEVLDAWAEVPIVQFRWKESVLAKGDDARIHFGLIAQSIRDTFASKGLDATRYGLLCFNEWEAIYEDIMEMVPVLDDEGNQVYENGEPKMETQATGERRLVREAGELWSIRPDQCAFLDIALARRERSRIDVRLTALESSAA